MPGRVEPSGPSSLDTTPTTVQPGRPPLLRPRTRGRRSSSTPKHSLEGKNSGRIPQDGVAPPGWDSHWAPPDHCHLDGINHVQVFRHHLGTPHTRSTSGIRLWCVWGHLHREGGINTADIVFLRTWQCEPSPALCTSPEAFSFTSSLSPIRKSAIHYSFLPLHHLPVQRLSPSLPVCAMQVGFLHIAPWVLLAGGY